VLVKKKKKKKIDLAVLTGEDGGGPPTLVIAEVLVCAPHPMAEKLTICTVDYGGPETARVVCGAPNVKAGLKVIFATVGAIIPSTGEKLVKTPLRGVMSEGMLLSAAEMGWMASAVGIIECPKRAPIGDPAPMDPPPDLAMADPAAKKNKSSKDSKKDKKDKKDKEDRPESPAPISDSSAPMNVAEIDAAVLLGAKKKKKKVVAFEEPAPTPKPTPAEPTPNSETPNDEPEPEKDPKQKKKKKKGSGGKEEDTGGDDDLDALFAELGIEADASATPVGESKAAKKRREKKERDAALGDGGEGADTDAVASDAPGGPASGDGDENVWEQQLEELEATHARGEKLNDAQKNKLKKLKKKKKEKDAKGEDGGAASGKSKAPKPSGAVLKMQEELRLREEACLVAASEENARLAAEKAEEAAAAAVEAELEAKREAKRLKEKAKKDKLRAEGKLLTTKQKADKAKMEAMREQLMQRTDSAGGAIDEDDAAPQKRVLIDDRKKKKEMFERKKAQEEERVLAEAASLKAEADAAAAAAEKGDGDDSSGDVEDDWDAVDNLDDLVKIPNAVADAAAAKAEAAANETAAVEAEAEQAKHAAREEKAAAEAVLAGKKKDVAAAKAAVSAAAKAKHAAAAKGPVKTKDDSASDDSGSDLGSGSASGSGSGSESGSDSDSDSDSESDDSDSSEYSSSEYDSDEEQERLFQTRMREAKKLRLGRFELKKLTRSKDKLRCPIICILGHVDTGKTKILDNIRRTNVQDGEAGGITQQIGATFIPASAILDRTEPVNKGVIDLQVPGLLVIDTPGHESFTNLRSRGKYFPFTTFRRLIAHTRLTFIFTISGSSLCDLAILVVDIMHGLEPQTLESLNMLRSRKTPFIIALNKIDRMFDWETHKDAASRTTLAAQKQHARLEFEDRAKKVMLEFANEGLNAAIYWDNPDPRKFINVVPTSAITGEGIPDMIHTLVDLTQTRMNERLRFFDAVQVRVFFLRFPNPTTVYITCLTVYLVTTGNGYQDGRQLLQIHHKCTVTCSLWSTG
jgi:translation initiation factor 5B